MRYEADQRVEVYLRAQEGLAELEPNPNKRRKYIDFIAKYANLSENEQALYEQYLERSFYKEAIMGPVQQALEQGMQRGMQQGMQQGIQQGRLEGEATVLLRQLSRRFHPLPNEISERIHSADPNSIEKWADRILDAKSLDEVFSD
uniref:DUF4351 domain-containing protein n=1 Tax=Candidatus Kentrum sp. TUN TaxID=2126343 RepID=A0A450ZWL5_9GAMM|nr:MAG: protein of unknown function (DUF4351) [Candidatus Kentron sp. TUN]